MSDSLLQDAWQQLVFLATVISLIFCLDFPQQPLSLSTVFEDMRSDSNRMSFTRGSPRVSVPVLSNTTDEMSFISSKGSPPRIKIPRRAPMPVPTMTAVGVANPNE